MGSTEAEIYIAEMYAFGKGLPKNESEACRWYRKSAERGNMFAQLNLGLFYYQGTGVPADYIQAYKWFRAYP
jgi:hypothetical protein